MNEIKGLTWKEATRALRQYGLNEVLSKNKPLWKIFLDQLKTPLIILLGITTLLSFSFGNITDSIVILTILLINLFITFNQQYGVINTYALLNRLIKSDVYVIRNGIKVLIDKSTVVPGDILVVNKGDVICADSYVIENEALVIDESKQTGASNDTYKEVNTELKRGFSKGILYSGSYVVSGEGLAKVFATGLRSKFTKSINREDKLALSNYEIKINKLSRTLLYFASATVSLIFLINILTKPETSIISIVLFSVALFISAIPQSLPMVTKLALFRGALKLSDENVIVKNNVALENLANIQVICTDKSGTLTLDKLKVDFFSTVIDKDGFFKYSYLSTIDNNDPLDKSILKYLKENHIQDHSEFMLEEIPFNEDREFSIRKFKDFEIIKGSHEYIFKLTKNDTQLDRELVELNVEKGLKVISLAVKEDNKAKYIGSFFYYDQVKEDAIKIIDSARHLGVLIKIITSDTKETSAFIAQKTSLITTYDEVITGDMLNFSNSTELLNQLTKYSVIAECSEEQKYKIIECLQSQYFTAYIGNGVEDSASQALANISIALDNSTNIAKQDSDVVLLSNGLEIVVNAISQSRGIFMNMDKYLRNSLAGKFGGFMTIGLLSIILDFLPLISVQILIYNLLTELPLFSLSADNIDSDESKAPYQHSIRKVLLFALTFGIISLIFDLIFFYIVRNQDSALVQTQWLALSVVTEIIILFSLRTKKGILNIQTAKPSTLLLKLSIVSLIVTVLLALFGLPGEFGRLPISSFALIGVISGVYFLFIESIKVPIIRIFKL